MLGSDAPVAVLKAMENHLDQSDQMARFLDRGRHLADLVAARPAIVANIERMQASAIVAAQAIKPVTPQLFANLNAAVDVMRLANPTPAVQLLMKDVVARSPVFNLTFEQLGIRSPFAQMQHLSGIAEAITEQVMTPELSKLIAGISDSVTAQLSDALRVSTWLNVPDFPHLWLGRPGRPRRMGVVEWLAVLRGDLPELREAMLAALAAPLQPVGSAAYFASQLLDHLLEILVPRREIVVEMIAKPQGALYLDMRSGEPRVTWSARGYAVAARSGLAEDERHAFATAATVGARLNDIRHHPYRYKVEDVEPLIKQVERMLFRLAGRCFPN